MQSSIRSDHIWEVEPTGPLNAKIMIVGDVPHSEDVESSLPFISSAGQELTRILADAGINREECYITNVVNKKPPYGLIEKYYEKNTKVSRIPGTTLKAGIQKLQQDIEKVKPHVIIALGDMALWALTLNIGIGKWRGSVLEPSLDFYKHPCKVIPTYHPSAILRKWDWRHIAVRDCQRAKHELSLGPVVQLPEYNFITRPSYQQTIEYLKQLSIDAYKAPLRLAGDLETRNGHIACFGIARSHLKAICIPFMCMEDNEGYWTYNEELEIIILIAKLFHHPNIQWVYQNGLYDYQYFFRHWHSIPILYQDTMVAQHCVWPGLPKGLDFLSSMYCGFHRYWKDEGKEWDPKKHDEDSYWIYNCKDAVTTWEISFTMDNLIQAYNLVQPHNLQLKRFYKTFDMMVRGVRQNLEVKESMGKELKLEADKRNKWLEDVLGHHLNVNSNKQVPALFYTDLKQKPIFRKRAKGKKTVSADDKALSEIKKRNPLLIPLVNKILELRSINLYKSTYVDMELDEDDRVRCSYNLAGTETFRYTSSKNAWGRGGNLQTITEGDEELDLPNIKKLFLPDPGYIIGDFDLKAADAQVVAWEAHDDELKTIFREGLNLHTENAEAIFNRRPHSDYDPIYKQAKIGVHATNYGGSAWAVASALGITIREAENFQRRWFAAHPGIKDWHRRVMDSLATSREVRNVFGFRRYYFDRIDRLLPEALAWIPQSTVALVIEIAMNNIYYDYPYIHNLLQVHDSSVNQFPEEQTTQALIDIKKAFDITIPYEEPLIIPVDGKISKVSWGHCEKITEWPKPI